jgi:hypothetical protein
MVADIRLARFAVSIDAHNTSAGIADSLFQEIAQIAEASVRRIWKLNDLFRNTQALEIEQPKDGPLRISLKAGT